MYYNDPMVRRGLKIVSVFFFILVFIFVTGKLFAPARTEQFLYLFKKVDQSAEETLVIGLSSGINSFDPTTGTVANRQVLLNIYEGIVFVDRNLEIQPGLAVTVGSVDDVTWEFRLRPGVLFHNGNTLTLDDVSASLAYARRDDSGIKNILDTIDTFEKVTDDIFRIKTTSPDPLFLQKLARVLVFPKNAESIIGKEPVGTGPYTLKTVREGNVVLERYPEYWGITPSFKSVWLETLSSRRERQNSLFQNSVDLLVDVPPELSLELEGREDVPYVFETLPSLEGAFLLFGFNGIMGDHRLRSAIYLTLDRTEIARLGFGFVRPSTQFVSPGIHGFNPGIVLPKIDTERAASLVKEVSPLDRVSGALDVPLGFEALGTFIQESLADIGIDLEVRLHEPQILEEKIKKHESDFHFFGWRSELADAGEFFDAVVKSSGEYAPPGYRNEDLDARLDAVRFENDPVKRLQELRDIMRVAVTEDIIGIPLFTPQILYAISKDIIWTPRVDGYVIAQEVRRR